MAAINQVGNALTGSSGTGSFAGTTSPSFTTPALGAPTAGVLSSCTGYAQSALTGLGTGVSTALGTNVNGSGAISLTTSPTLVTPILGVATATSISFGDTALSTYLQGTWTPTFTSSGGGTATYSTQTGTYTLIGNRLLYNLFLVLTGLPSSGTVTITGLPVTIGQYASASVYATTLSAAVTSPLIATLNAGGTAILLYTFAAGSASAFTVAGASTSSVFIISGEYSI